MTQITLAAKLEGILKDPELASELGVYIEQLVMPALVECGKLTEEQSDHLGAVYDHTLLTMLTPEQIKAAHEEAESYMLRYGINYVSPFAKPAGDL